MVRRNPPSAERGPQAGAPAVEPPAVPLSRAQLQADIPMRLQRLEERQRSLMTQLERCEEQLNRQEAEIAAHDGILSELRVDRIADRRVLDTLASRGTRLRHNANSLMNFRDQAVGYGTNLSATVSSLNRDMNAIALRVSRLEGAN